MTSPLKLTTNNVSVVKQHSCINNNNNNHDDRTTNTNDDIHYGRILKIYSNNSTSTCRTLQRKLEMKVERAKRNYNQLYEVNVSLFITSYQNKYEKV